MFTLKEIYFRDFLFEKSNDEKPTEIKVWPLEDILKLYTFDNAVEYSDSSKYTLFRPGYNNIISRTLGIRKAPIVSKTTKNGRIYIYAYGLSGNIGLTVIDDPTTAEQRIKNTFEQIHYYVKSWYEKEYLPEVKFLAKILKLSKKHAGDKYGEFFGGTQRMLPVDNSEVNTPEEQELVTNIKNHIYDAGDTLDKKDSKEINKILKKGIYNDVFLKPDSSVVYRGMAVDRWTLKEFLKGIEEEKYKLGIPKKGEINPRKKLIFKPARTEISRTDRGASSWSTSFETAKKFTDSYQANQAAKIKIILVAKANENMYRLFDLKNWYSEFGQESFAVENEVIGLGNIVIDKIIWGI
jgi:hypothetical protein